MSNTEIKRTLEDKPVKSKKMKKDSFLEENFINYFSVPSLESIAIINVTTGLCNQSDIRDAIRQHSLKFDPVGGMSRGTCHDKSFQELKKSFLTKLSFIQLPNLLKVKVANIFASVILQMLQWIRHGRKDIEYINSICWTIEGTIDKVKTFQQLVNKDSAQFHIEIFYELACRFCLESSIFSLWNKLPKALQKDYEEKVYKKYDNHLIAYWICIVKNDLSELLVKIKQFDHKHIYNCNDTIYKNMVTLAVNDGNVLAVKYFWNKLTNEEISGNLIQWVKYSLYNRKGFNAMHQNIYDISEVSFFLLSQMDDSSQQKEIFQEHSKKILHLLFSHWPWQRYLLPTIQKIWFSLDQKVYLELLLNIVNEIEENKNTHQLLRKLWENSPIDLKKYFIQYIMRFNTDVFCNLLTIGDMVTIKLILNYANVEEKKHIMFSVVQNRKLHKIIYTDKLSLFDMLLGDTLSSDSDIKELKEKIALKCGNDLCCDWICDDNFQMVEKFFKWAFTSQDQIDNFKNKVLDKMEVTYRILKDLGNYELVDKFMSWCFSSEQESNLFKKNFAKSKYQIVTIGEENWDKFEKFIRWCFISNEDIKDFRCSILESGQLSNIIFEKIIFNYNFEFADKLIGWCCYSIEEIKQFKAGFVLSQHWLDILQRFVSNYKVYDSDCNNWVLTKKLIKLFFPLEENVTIEVKEAIKEYIEFNDFLADTVHEKDLFCLIDNNDYNIEYEL